MNTVSKSGPRVSDASAPATGRSPLIGWAWLVGFALSLSVLADVFLDFPQGVPGSLRLVAGIVAVLVAVACALRYLPRSSGGGTALGAVAAAILLINVIQALV